MKITSAYALGLFSGATICAAWKHLDKPDFLRAVGGHSVALIAFVDPSTAATQALESEWVATSEAEKALASVDCTVQPQLCRDYDVISYPTIRYFDGHGTITPYRGPRTSASIVSYLRRASRPAVTILDDSKVTAFQSIDDAVIVAYLNQHDSHIQTRFKSLAFQHKDQASFGTLASEAQTTLVCYNNKDDEQSTATDFTAVDALPSFVELCTKPLIGEFSRRTETKYMQSGKSLVYYIAETRREREEYTEAIRPIAKKYKQFIAFVTIDANEYGSMTRVLGLPADSYPALAIENPGRGQIFPFVEQEITPEAVEHFILEIAGGRIKPWTPSPVPDPAGHPHDEL